MRWATTTIRRTALGALTVALSATAAVAPALAHGTPAKRAAAVTAGHSNCLSRTLVLSAMPIELEPLLSHEKVTSTVVNGPHTYYIGRLEAHNVVLSLTGIGPVNARASTRAALAQFRCDGHSSIKQILFSGEAGGDYIGDAIVPTSWTADHGKHDYGVNPRLLHAARMVVKHQPKLEQTTPAGDPACACVFSPGLVKSVTVTHKPVVEVGGRGQTTDPFDGRALPCIPGGGDVFGCSPCPDPAQTGEHVQHFANGIDPFLNPQWMEAYGSVDESGNYVIEDEETAVVDQVAHAHHVPFLGIRAVSDGLTSNDGDPLHLPGFPVEFLAFRQISADNAATTTRAILRRS